MFASLAKYQHVVLIGIQNTLAYRVNFLARACFGLIPLSATIQLWRAIYEGKASGSNVAEYSLAQMISYYLFVTLVDALSAVNEDDWQIAADIKDGRISQFLLKPIDYLGYRLSLFFAGRMIYASVAILPAIAFGFFLREHLILPTDATRWLLFGISVSMAALLQFFISYTMALLAFWVSEVSTFIFILFAFEYITSGHLFPLDILPQPIADVIYWTPFPYQLFFPISVLMGKATGSELTGGLSLQLAWVLASWLLARIVWRRGIKSYTAVGG